MGWRFTVLHIPGSKLGGPDALSRQSQQGTKLNAMAATKEMYEHFDEEIENEIPGFAFQSALRTLDEEDASNMMDNVDVMLGSTNLSVKEKNKGNGQRRQEFSIVKNMN